MKRLAIVVVASFALVALVGAGAVVAKTSKATFDYHVGDGFAGVFNDPNVARASNGDTIEVRIGGTFDGGDKSASNTTGSFEHKRGGAVVGSGTITATRLIAFQFYGCGVPGHPDWCGGRALLAVNLNPGGDPSQAIDALLEINCQVGDPPPGTAEGIKLNAKGINFNKPVVGGINVFVQK